MKRPGLWMAIAVGIAVAIWAASAAGCAGMFGGDGTSARIEVANDLPVVGDAVGGPGEALRVSVQSVDRPENDRFLGTVERGQRRTFTFGPTNWDRSYVLRAGSITSGPVDLGPGVRVRWSLAANSVQVIEEPLEDDRYSAAGGVPAAR